MRKRFFAAIAACILALCAGETVTFAKHNVGVIGGCTFSTGFKDIKTSTLTQYHAGVAFKFKLPLGFALQPSVLYQVKGVQFDGLSSIKEDFSKFSAGFLEIPVSVQWGPDLIICRPFVEFVPFVGYGLNNNIKDWTDLNRWEYGLGLGAGIDIWRFQVNARYNWNFGSLAKADFNQASDTVINAFKDKNFGGVTLSLAFYF
ncbi:MAG: outer membrane beta-barrel protein [Candidatus Cryptobacteroides sp.]